MFGLGAGELLLIFVIAILFLGPKKIPELAKGLGQAVREFQKARDEMMNEINKTPPAASQTTAEVSKKADVEVTAVKVESATDTPESPKQS
ncbi:twin-arginine translocase TatA/TatE family subunit [Bacteriovorax sp. PP10]|jgi:TatA/E family protein of Tat protein translocase|uniref:Sec-independent protein translocase protein TatA n=1 Tax=Bacteriovorax antarcticus TaxID=3088717 RepID=A0ABU5W108_9BACT|nr:twin-arginine translocase TatA/TatE family subunit [Bacteriovorax sp. PP10]MEA9358502.1 twin-arginine translocase TatA/TatE family subunit [Bacteriovorax sp. PP10]